MAIRLLIITQKVDINDPILGFFHRWIEEFAKHCEKITVICLGKGKYNLPDNVEVLSLGKENRGPRISYAFLFFKYIFSNLGNYNTVFVHMNQEYILLGGVFWRLFGKKILFWRNHLKGSFLTDISVFLSNMTFCTSPSSYTARFKKTQIMPAGIDTDFFRQDLPVKKKLSSILFFGRIAPVKKVDIFVDALKELHEQGIEFSATIAGASLPIDAGYEKTIKDKVNAFGLNERVRFTGSLSQAEALETYKKHEVYVNLTPSGSLDKTIFEALASGMKVLVSNTFFSGVLPEDWIVESPEDPGNLARIIKMALNGPPESLETQKKISIFLQEHSLSALTEKLAREFTP
ncbi:MAG: glycosyltransferase family 4 protein [Patescibacteria group bacterium]